MGKALKVNRGSLLEGFNLSSVENVTGWTSSLQATAGATVQTPINGHKYVIYFVASTGLKGTCYCLMLVLNTETGVVTSIGSTTNAALTYAAVTVSSDFAVLSVASNAPSSFFYSIAYAD